MASIEFQPCKLQQDVNGDVSPMEINILIWTEYLKSIGLNLWRNTIVKIQSCLHWNIDLISAKKLTKWDLYLVFSQIVLQVKKELI